jgi:RNA polymerase sigma-70 factor (ECF subfamily)
MMSDNKKAFREFFEQAYPVLCSFGARYLGDQSAAEDVAQDVLLSYWEERRQFASAAEARGFLYASVRNRCINILRREQVGQRYADHLRESGGDSFEEDVFEHEVLGLLLKAVGELPRQMRRIIEYSLGGMRSAEIAREMNIAEGSLHKLKKIAYRKLREVLHNPF